MTSRRRFIRNASLATVGAASLVNSNCACEGCLDAGHLELLVFFGFVPGEKAALRAWLNRREQDCEDEKAAEAFQAASLLNQTGRVVVAPRSNAAVTLPAETSNQTDYAQTALRAAVLARPDRVWILDSYGNPRIRIVNAATLALVSDIDLSRDSQYLSMVRSPDRSAVYVLRSASAPSPASVLSFNPVTNAQTTFIELGGNQRLLEISISPDGRYLYVAADASSPTQNSYPIYVVETATRRLINTIANATLIPGKVVFTPDSALAFFADQRGIVVVDTASGSVVARPSLLIPGKIAISPFGDRLYVTSSSVRLPSDFSTSYSGVYVLDTSSFATVGYTLFSEPNRIRSVESLTVDARSGVLYVSFSREQGFHRVNPYTNEVDAFFQPVLNGGAEITHILIDTA